MLEDIGDRELRKQAFTEENLVFSSSHHESPHQSLYNKPERRERVKRKMYEHAFRTMLQKYIMFKIICDDMRAR